MPAQTSDLGAMPPLHAAQRSLLERFHFDRNSWLRLRHDLMRGQFPPARNQVAGPIAPPQAADLQPWPGPRDLACIAAGRAAIAAGQVAVAILNGGMATRFGGRVKGVVEVCDGHSFLALKLRDVAVHAPCAPVFIMNSFATRADTERHLQHHAYFGLDPDQVHLVDQGISIRMTPEGAPVVDAGGDVSLYAPGHGDLLASLAAHAAFAAFVRAGGRAITVSNVDNLAAVVSAEVVGLHLAAGRAVTVEVADRAPGDAGGAPVRRGGRVEVLEAFRLPDGFDVAQLPVFNTNTFVLDGAVVHDRHPLTWFRVDKKVSGQLLVQFERLLGEVTSFVPSTYLRVPREGRNCRFLPVKAPNELPRVIAWVRQYLLT